MGSDRKYPCSYGFVRYKNLSEGEKVLNRARSEELIGLTLPKFLHLIENVRIALITYILIQNHFLTRGRL